MQFRVIFDTQMKVALLSYLTKFCFNLLQKLEAKHDTDPKAFVTLQNIVYQELKSNTCTVKNSATDALLWLKRWVK